MMALKAKKPKPLKVKEARALVEKQAVALGKMCLVASELRNEVESLEGARINLKTMYDVHEGEMNRMRETEKATQESLRAHTGHLDRCIKAAEGLAREVKTYENEPATRMWIRSMKKATAPTRKAISSFIERVRFPFKKVKQ